MTEAKLLSLEVDLDELCIALEAEAADLRWFLDLESGNVILLNGEYDPMENGGLPASEVESQSSRFQRIPAANPSDSVDDMRAFAAQVEDERLRESLELALAAPGPHRRFRAVLGWLKDEQDRWHRFRAERCGVRSLAWLRSVGVDPVGRKSVA